MWVAVVGGSGKVGSWLVAELLDRSHEVTVVSRHAGQMVSRPGLTQLQGDAADPVALAKDLAGHDVVVSVVRFVDFAPDDMLAALRGAKVKRYLSVGGAGSLRHPEGGLIYDRGNMTESVRTNSRMGGVWLDRLRESGLDWTMLCPGNRFYDGERTGKFRLGGDEAIFAADGTSSISYQDFAVALVDELEHPRHRGTRFTVGY
ncbi:NAD(P)-dependent oxidoreductase [Rhizobium rhizogenes]|uniref:NAD(P)-dependent oxidoreductase n=1 Tax=Rhizobium rhizogenes TaxID=359 RepID=UPI0015749A7B|nr:NAD(P)H-binding protein [Rhizobium rhizogenes]NTF97914.1 NAD(P)H-binding protein [Rhizobium rhizogenes]